MQLTINDKEYHFKFGVRFVRELDLNHPVEREGMKFGFALQTKMAELLASNISSLADVLYAAGATEKPRPSLVAIEHYIDDCEDIEFLFDEVIKELEESNSGKLLTKTMKAEMKKA